MDRTVYRRGRVPGCSQAVTGTSGILQRTRTRTPGLGAIWCDQCRPMRWQDTRRRPSELRVGRNSPRAAARSARRRCVCRNAGRSAYRGAGSMGIAKRCRGFLSWSWGRGSCQPIAYSSRSNSRPEPGFLDVTWLSTPRNALRKVSGLRPASTYGAMDKQPRVM